jgi:hypothetical protein
VCVDPGKLADRLRPSFRQDAVRHLNRRSLWLMLDLGYHFTFGSRRTAAMRQSKASAMRQFRFLNTSKSHLRHVGTPQASHAGVYGSRYWYNPTLPARPGNPRRAAGPRFPVPGPRLPVPAESGNGGFPDSGRVGNRGFPPRFPAKSGIGGTVTPGMCTGSWGLPGSAHCSCTPPKCESALEVTTMRKEAPSVLRAQ